MTQKLITYCVKRDKHLGFESMNITEIFVIQKAYKVLP